MLVTNLPRGAMQVARTRVVTQPGPQVQHLVDFRIGERAHAGKPLHETLEIGNHGRDLRLLQHDLRHPHAVGRALALPRQIMTPMTRMPGSEARRDGLWARAHDFVGGCALRRPCSSSSRRSVTPFITMSS